MKKILSQQRMIMLGLLLLPLSSFAAQTGVNSWERILGSIVNSLTGPVAYAISVMAIFSCGLVMAFADLQGGAKRFVQAGCGISVAIFASQILTGFMGFNGAVL